MDVSAALGHRLHETEEKLLHELRVVRARARAAHIQNEEAKDQLTLGQRVADGVAAVMGSWNFIIAQSVILLFWVVLNVVAWVEHWDPYPFILLNLALSFQAAYAAPIIMMSQNRQADIDRRAAESDYRINIKAELEIESLHQKLDQIREMEIVRLTDEVRALTELLKQSEANHGRLPR
jgi:uncharacterized membrane protein